MFFDITYYFLLFMTYSFIGWVFECIYVSIRKRKLENRGFLFGPICPIYGVGALFAIFLTNLLQLPWYLEFFLIAIVCDIIEYSTSVVMEKIYHVRWWDYTNEWKFHLNGRISLETSIGFGLGGLFVIHLLHPIISHNLLKLSPKVLLIVAIFLLVILVIDTILSTIAASSVKEILKGGHIDLTGEIKKISRDYYKKASRLSRKVTRTAVKHVKQMQKMTKKNLAKAQKATKKNLAKAQKIAKTNLLKAQETANRRFAKTQGFATKKYHKFSSRETRKKARD